MNAILETSAASVPDEGLLKARLFTAGPHPPPKWEGERVPLFGGTLQVQYLPLDLLRPSPIRLSFPEDAVEALRASIERFGLVYPLWVTQDREGYKVLDGNLRYQALRRLGVGRTLQVPCFVFQGNSPVPTSSRTGLYLQSASRLVRPTASLERFVAFYRGVQEMVHPRVGEIMEVALQATNTYATGKGKFIAGKEEAKGEIYATTFANFLAAYGLTPAEGLSQYRLFQRLRPEVREALLRGDLPASFAISLASGKVMALPEGEYQKLFRKALELAKDPKGPSLFRKAVRETVMRYPEARNREMARFLKALARRFTPEELRQAGEFLLTYREEPLKRTVGRKGERKGN